MDWPWCLLLVLISIKATDARNRLDMSAIQNDEGLEPNINHTCLTIRHSELENNFEEAFEKVAQTKIYTKVSFKGLGHTHENGETHYEAITHFTRADKHKTRLYERHMQVLVHNDEVVKVEEGMLRVLNNVLLLDEHTESGATVMLTENDYGDEQYLTVNTSDAKTSCTIRLHMYSNIHGKVLTDNIFGTLKFSPDGK